MKRKEGTISNFDLVTIFLIKDTLSLNSVPTVWIMSRFSRDLALPSLTQIMFLEKHRFEVDI